MKFDTTAELFREAVSEQFSSVVYLSHEKLRIKKKMTINDSRSMFRR